MVWPTLTDALGNEILDASGVIEPLAIRSTFSGSYSAAIATFKEHKIRGTIESGNEDLLNQSTNIISQFYKTTKSSSYWFEDSFDTTLFSGTNYGAVAPTLSSSLNFINFRFVKPRYKFIANESPPFDDGLLKFGLQLTGSVYNKASASFDDQTLLNYILKMTGTSTENYVPLNSKSGGTGFTYDTTNFNIDSLAFGGLKY
jgi:hypothetical protein